MSERNPAAIKIRLSTQSSFNSFLQAESFRLGNALLNSSTKPPSSVSSCLFRGAQWTATTGAMNSIRGRLPNSQHLKSPRCPSRNYSLINYVCAGAPTAERRGITGWLCGSCLLCQTQAEIRNLLWSEIAAYGSSPVRIPLTASPSRDSDGKLAQSESLVGHIVAARERRESN